MPRHSYAEPCPWTGPSDSISRSPVTGDPARGIVPEHRLFLLPTEQPVEHARGRRPRQRR